MDFDWFDALLKKQKDAVTPLGKREIYCEQCGKRFVEQPNTRDPGICSLDCGYKYRGLNPFDFL